MNTYAQLDTFIGKRDAKHIPSIRATTVYRMEDGTIIVRYHETAVVRAHQDGTFILTSGGYHTSTTKARINAFSPARVYQKAFRWYVGEKMPFVDGMRVDAQGVAV